MTYIHSLSFQLTAFLRSVGAGFILGAVYSAFRFPGRLFAKTAVSVVTDIAFCLFACFFTFCFILAFNDGEIRNYVFLGELLGGLIFAFSTGTLVSKAQFAAAKRLRRALNRKKMLKNGGDGEN